MTKLESLLIEGLSGRRSQLEIELDESVNVFWGLNGSGKTSLLRILHSALQNDAAGLHRIAFREATVRFYSSEHKKSFTRRAEHRVTNDDQLRVMETDEGEIVRLVEQDRRMRWVTSPTLKVRAPSGRRFSHAYLPTSRLDLFRDNARTRYAVQEGRAETAYDEAFATVINDLWIRLNNQTLSAQRAVQQRGLADIMSLSVTGTSPNESFEDAEHISPSDAFDIFDHFLAAQDMPANVDHKKFITRYEQDPVQRQIIASIVRLNGRMAEASKALDQLFDLVDSMFSGTKRLERGAGHLVFLGEDGERIPLSGLSSGEKQLVYILMECVGAGPHVVLIDEPELSLHVDWQQALIGAIRTVNPLVQVLIATHSPEIMANVADRNIIQL